MNHQLFGFKQSSTADTTSNIRVYTGWYPYLMRVFTSTQTEGILWSVRDLNSSDSLVVFGKGTTAATLAPSLNTSEGVEWLDDGLIIKNFSFYQSNSANYIVEVTGNPGSNLSFVPIDEIPSWYDQATNGMFSPEQAALISQGLYIEPSS